MKQVAAVIGAGFVGKAHIEALRRLPVPVRGTLVSSGERSSEGTGTGARLQERRRNRVRSRSDGRAYLHAELRTFRTGCKIDARRETRSMREASGDGLARVGDAGRS